MKPNDLAIGLRDLSDKLNVCGNDYSDILYTAATQLEQRLLTDAEREAIGRAADWLAKAAESRNDIHTAGYLCDDAAALRKLLERLG